MHKHSLTWVLVLLALSACKSVPTPSAQEITREKLLSGKRIAILATDGVEQIELLEPRKALLRAGAEVIVISPKKNKLQGYNHDKKADLIKVDRALSDSYPENFDALLLPGGVANPDKLRINAEAIEFIKAIGKAGKPIAAICHGPWPLINAGLVDGYKLTSWPSLEQDLKNAGAHWVNEEVVVDKNLVTSRKPEDIPAFNEAMIKLFAKN